MKTEVIHGFHPVFEALQAARRKFIKVYAAGDKPVKRLDKIIALAEDKNILVKKIPTPRLKQITGSDQHQGVAATVSIYPLVDVSYLVDRLGSDAQDRFLVLLDNILDPQNFGAIVRTALAVGVDGVVTPKDRSVAPTPAVSKASAGALEHVLVSRVTNLVTIIKSLKKEGIWIFGLDKAAKISIFTRDLSGSLAIVIGGEQKGIRPLVKKHCDFLISIPQVGRINSLNASAAAAVAMYEVFRQRKVS
jgi:23S rRNA (guanosine2251-2'-O)-methyltransferase